MNKYIILLLAVISGLYAVSCNKSSPAQPPVQNTPTATIQLTGTITPTATVTMSPTAVSAIVIDDFEDSTLLVNLIDEPNNPWFLPDDLGIGSGSSWSASGYCVNLTGGQAMSLTGTVKAGFPTTGQYMGLLAVTTTVKTGSSGIDASVFSAVNIKVQFIASPASGNMLYTFRLYNRYGQYLTYNPTVTGSWASYVIDFTSFTVGGAWTAQDVLTDLCGLEIRAQLFTAVQDDEAPLNLCLDHVELIP